jgi:hypothetical protein
MLIAPGEPVLFGLPIGLHVNAQLLRRVTHASPNDGQR